jgi:hypothetical protein
MGRNFLSFTVLIGLVISACNQPFDPRDSLDQKLVVFSVLSTDRSQQMVRVERNYMPVDYDALAYTADVSVGGANVTLSSGATTYLLRDTTFPRSDTSRYTSQLHGYVLSSFKPEYGKSYEVRVQSIQYGSAVGAVLIPSKPFLSLDASSYTVLDYPTITPREANILFPVVCGGNAKAYIVRLFVDYDVLKDGEWIAERAEIPVRYKYSGLVDFNYVSYGTLTPTPVNGRTVGVYKNDLYNRKLVELAYQTYFNTKIIFNRVVFQYLQVDPHLYDYYIVTHAYNDPHSTRLDEPSYSNVMQGEGVVGAYTLDSLVHVLPEGFGFNKR